jgi:hypothetical protein
MEKEWHQATKPLSITIERGQCGDHGTFLSCTSRFSEKKNPTGKNIRRRRVFPYQHTIATYKSSGKSGQLSAARNEQST